MGIFYQVQTTFACSFGALVTGLLYVWPSYTLELYKAENTTVLSAPMTELECSLLGSMPPLGAMVGSAIPGVLMEGIGRQKTGIAISLPYVISWTIIELFSSSTMILLARFVGGISAGAALVFAPIFISEIAQDSIRGTLASGPILFCFMGNLISYLMGWFLTYHPIIWLNLAASVASALLFTMVTESPLYFLKQNKEEEALKAIARYRGASVSSKEVLEEFSRLKQQVIPPRPLTTIVRDESEAKVEEGEKEKLNSENVCIEDEIPLPPIRKLFLSPSCRRALMVVGITISMQVFMGMVPVMVYAKDLFSKAVPDLSSHFCSTLLALVVMMGSLISAAVTDKAGRRILLMTSSILVCMAMVSLGVLLQNSVNPRWISVVVILIFCVSFSLGAGTVPYVLLAEIFLPEVQSMASLLLIEWVWFLNFVLIALFPLVNAGVGFHGACYIFAGVALANTVLSYLLVPETKGLSTQQIQEAFLRRKN